MRVSTPTSVAPAVSSGSAGTDRQPLRLSLRGLLALYLVVPLALAAWAVDAMFLDHSLRASLPDKPTDYFLFELVFGWPHIVASTIILTTNGEYLDLYRRRLVVVSAIVIAFFLVGYFTLPYSALFFVAATATIIHVLKQQIGIGRGAARISSRSYTLWGWSSIGVGVVLYNALFLAELDSYRTELVLLAVILAVPSLVLAVRLHAEIETGLGRLFLWSNTALVVSALAFYAAGYGIFAIAVPRVVHDTTAFAFYVAHDVNKHRAGPRNRLYRVANAIPGGIYWVTPVLAIATAYLLAQHGDAVFHWLSGNLFADSVPKAVSLGLLGYLGMMHYYYESFTWKTGSPYRAFVPMRA